jgi:hypothetical protein
MTNKELILSELAHDYGMNELQVENLIYLLLEDDELLRYHLRTSINMKLKGDN